MGTVYRATQLSLNRSVALKVLSSDFGDDASFRERFRREGLLQAAIDHPHIVTVYDTGESEHGLYLVMRMVRGPTLKDMILSRELDPGRTLRLLAQVADALDTAHEVGLTHRDIKPQNILIGSRDHAYLADFGLTKAPDEAGRLTATGQFVGTIDYVSPEQIQGESASERSDIYALTGVLYECLVGTVPYPRPAEAAVVYAHISEPPPVPTKDRPELPPEIDEVIAKGMAKAPEDRYASAGELLREAGRVFGEAVGEVPGPIVVPEEAGVRGNGAETKPAGTALSGSPEDQLGGVTAASPVHAPAPTRPARPAAGATVPSAGTAPRRGVPILAVAAVLAVLAAVAGFLIGGSGSSSEPSTPDLANSASAGDLSLSFPAGWRRVTEAPNVPGMRFSQPIVLSPSGPRGARLNAGMVDAAGPTLLPPGFRSRLSRQPSRRRQGEARAPAGLPLRGPGGAWPRGPRHGVLGATPRRAWPPLPARPRPRVPTRPSWPNASRSRERWRSPMGIRLRSVRARTTRKRPARRSGRSTDRSRRGLGGSETPPNRTARPPPRPTSPRPIARPRAPCPRRRSAPGRAGPTRGW